MVRIAMVVAGWLGVQAPMNLPREAPATTP
jgi:hypothetical protein